MKVKQLRPEEIESNFERFRGLLKKLGNRQESAEKLVDHLAERLALCPASSRVDYHSPYPGGLVEHSMRVLNVALLLRKTFEINVPISSIVLCSLFHDIGKVGNLTQDYYLPQDSEWHRTKLGEYFKHNSSMQYMTVPHRSVFLLQHFGVTMNEDEMLAVLLHDGQYADDNRPYRMKEPRLADLIHWADVMATKEEKEELLDD